eukprot:scaffold111002_cov62-Attheya_sp.AAC.1
MDGFSDARLPAKELRPACQSVPRCQYHFVTNDGFDCHACILERGMLLDNFLMDDVCQCQFIHVITHVAT